MVNAARDDAGHTRLGESSINQRDPDSVLACLESAGRRICGLNPSVRIRGEGPILSGCRIWLLPVVVLHFFCWAYVL
jgi:hypothetical protein